MIRRKKGKAIAQQFVVCAGGLDYAALILAGLLARAALHTLYADPGFGYEQVLSSTPGLNDHGYTPATARTYLDELQTRLRAVPGVTSVSAAFSHPW